MSSGNPSVPLRMPSSGNNTSGSRNRSDSHSDRGTAGGPQTGGTTSRPAGRTAGGIRQAINDWCQRDTALAERTGRSVVLVVRDFF